MKWFLIKIACIAAGYLIGAWVCHDPIGGVLIAPFGWIVGKAVELRANTRKVGVTGYRTAVAEGSEEEYCIDFLWKPGDAMDMALNPFNPWYDVDDE